MSSQIILGLDVSTKCTGVCVFEDDGSENGKILELTHITPKASSKLPVIEQLFIKDNVFKDKFLGMWRNLQDKVKIDRVIIEEPLIRSNNALTVATLLRFNGMVSKSVYDELGIIPEYISSYNARLFAFPELVSVRKYAKDGHIYHIKKIFDSLRESQVVLFGGMPWDIDKKEVLWNIIQERYPDIKWLYKKNGELKKENFDMSDALVLCLAAKNINQNQTEPEFSVSNIKKRNDSIYDYNLSFWGKTIQKSVEGSLISEKEYRKIKKERLGKDFVEDEEEMDENFD